jgi:hypothetical protein
MKAQVSIAAVVTSGVVGMAASGHAAQPSPDAMAARQGAPQIEQMVVFRRGAVVDGRVPAKPTAATVDGRRCAVAARTALATLLRADPGRIGFHDYGDCSSRAADSAGLFVKSIRGERNRGQDGWVYKVGRKLATAGAADPAGPFGDGRLRAGQRVLWFYCRQLDAGTCQRSLEVDTAVDGRRLSVTVTGYDDAGDGVAVKGAKVVAGDERATTGVDGRATLTLDRGSYRVHAAKRGAIRSFAKRVKIG